MLAEVSVGVLETYAMTLPLAGFGAETTQRCYCAACELLEGYMLGGSGPVPYARTAHVAAAWLPLVAATQPRNRRLLMELEHMLVRTFGVGGAEPGRPIRLARRIVASAARAALAA